MPARRSILCILFLSAAASAYAEFTPKERAANLESFEIVWRTVRDRHPDPKLNGLNWQAVHDATRPQIAKAESIEQVRTALRAMLANLSASHYAIIPSELYVSADQASGHSARPAETAQPVNDPHDAGSNAPAVSGEGAVPLRTPDSAQGAPGGSVTPTHAAGEPAPANGDSAGKLVAFGNLPATRVFFEARRLPGGAGYIRFNEFLDPVSIMPKFEAAVKEFNTSPGIILDLRGNPGGIGIMAMGIAGFFVAKPGQRLGEMKMREATLKFVVFPRPQTYGGPLAILVDERSASTSEILAQGLQDLGRARIFGTRTAGAALPSDIVRLPNGDGFQFAQASYTSEKGRVLEGNGVTPDVEVHQTGEARQSQEGPVTGHDAVIEAAEAWIGSLRH